ncbi:MAG: DNA alkylation repair protein [Bacteroidota bacterium]
MDEILLILKKKKNVSKAKITAGFFKTKKGEYGEGDIFWGIDVPFLREIEKKYFLQIDFLEIEFFLNQKIHELRFLGVIFLVKKYQKEKNEKQKEKIVNFYLKNISHINNWDLVDVSAPKILGDYFFSQDKKILYQLVKSKNLWERRIAILATLGFIRKNSFADTLKMAQILLLDREDLIQKAVGWMLREVGKKDQKILEEFLKKNKNQMARTTLRYAIEKFSLEKRKKYLEKK